MNILALAEAWWAQHAIHLDPEPEGERTGTVNATDSQAQPLRLITVGDSMIAGCGVDDQAHGLTPDMAAEFSHILGKPITWEAHGKLGATMRRVRYRLLPQIDGTADLLIICAGSNDLMARRTPQEWENDLAATIDEAKAISGNIIVFSAVQLYRSPSLGASLRKVIEGMTNEQTAISKTVCDKNNVLFLDMTHEDVHADQDRFYAHDRFHPSDYGYRYMAERIGTLIGPWLKEHLD